MLPRPPAPARLDLRFRGDDIARNTMGTTMSNSPRPRGRPRGTGIDDRETLRAVTSLLVENSGLRPTTAIRQVGINDPSVVRRLREKLKTLPTTAQDPAPAVKSLQTKFPRKYRSATDIEGQSSEPSTVKTKAWRSPQTKDNSSQASSPIGSPHAVGATSAEAPNPPADVPGTLANPITGERPPLADPQLEALRLAAEAAGAMSRLYLHCMNFAAQTNPMSLALRTQSIMSEFMVGMLTGQLPRIPVFKTG